MPLYPEITGQGSKANTTDDHAVVVAVEAGPSTGNPIAAGNSNAAPSSTTAGDSTPAAGPTSPAAPKPPVVINRPPKTFCIKVSEFAVGVCYGIAILMICVVVWQLVQRSSENHVVAWAIGAIFVGLSLPLSLHDIHLHMANYVSPLQRYYIRIIWMVPIYGIVSWLSLRFKEQSIYLETAREAYEAYVIHSFFQLMLDYLGDRNALKATLISERGPRVKVCCCGTRSFNFWKNGGSFIHRCALGVWQYVLVKVVFAIAVFIAETMHTYSEDSFYDYKNLYVYNALFLNASQMYALYCLGLFYKETRAHLGPISPVVKFIVVKAIVFFSWWQSIGISGEFVVVKAIVFFSRWQSIGISGEFIVVKAIVFFSRWQSIGVRGLVSVGVIQGTLTYTATEVSKGLQDFLICIEMLGFAIAHHYVFSVTDFWRDDRLGPIASKESLGVVAATMDVLPSDLIQQGKNYVGSGFGVKHKREKRKTGAGTVVSSQPPNAAGGAGGDASGAPKNADYE